MISASHSANPSAIEARALDHATLVLLRGQHPAWRMLAADSAPLVASFLHRLFVLPNTRVVAQTKLADALDDYLHFLRQDIGESIYPKAALEYLNDWEPMIAGGCVATIHRTLTSRTLT